jgi:NDP-sugar pyrophosphorylase family protein
MKRAVILAGGVGARLRPYTTVLPKPLMPIGDRPILDIVIRQLKRAGFERITIASGYLAELLEAFFRDGTNYGLAIDYHVEQERMGTVGSLALIDGLEDEEAFLVMNGDVLTDLDYAVHLEAHRNSDAIATIATYNRSVEVSLGVMKLEDEADPTRLTGYLEKPVYDFQVSMGVYAFSSAVLPYIEKGVYLDLPDLVLRLLADGKTVRGYPFDGYWLDIGRHEDYEQATADFESHRSILLPEE